MSTRLSFLLRMAAILSLLLFALVALTGCATNPPMQPTDASYIAGGAAKATWGHGESLKYDLDQAVAYLKYQAGRLFIDAAYKELDAMFANLADVMKHEQIVNTNYNAVVMAGIKSDERLIAEHGHFWSYQQRLWWKWILGIAATVTLALFIIHKFALGGSILTALPFTEIFKRFFGAKS